MVTIFIITKNKESAKEIAMRILEERLAYSLNILDNVFSMRREKGKIVEYHETLILAKTKALLYHKVEELIKNLDADHQPLVFSFPITQMQQTLFDSIQATTLKV
ncbi:MAG: divalent cation tolerance protein CutA [Bacteroidota bacterium]